MNPSLSGGLASIELDPLIYVITHDPLQNNLEDLGPSISDVDSFMTQLGNVTFVNAIIAKNRETIMANFQRDNISAFGFGRPPPLDILDPTHPLFGRLPPPIGPFDLNDLFFILR